MNASMLGSSSVALYVSSLYLLRAPGSKGRRQTADRKPRTGCTDFPGSDQLAGDQRRGFAGSGDGTVLSTRHTLLLFMEPSWFCVEKRCIISVKGVAEPEHMMESWRENF